MITPGQWLVAPTRWHTGFTGPMMDVQVVRRQQWTNVANYITPDDARLIAAAPDLLAALRVARMAMRSALQRETDGAMRLTIEGAIDGAEAAIARAIGEGE